MIVSLQLELTLLATLRAYNLRHIVWCFEIMIYRFTYIEHSGTETVNCKYYYERVYLLPIHAPDKKTYNDISGCRRS